MSEKEMKNELLTQDEKAEIFSYIYHFKYEDGISNFNFFVGCVNMNSKKQYTKEQVKKLCKQLEKTCPKCNAKLLPRHGSNGYFIGCSTFPKCKHTENMPF